MFKFLVIASSILGLSLAQGEVTAVEIDQYMEETSRDPDFLVDKLSCVEMDCIYREATNDDRWWTAAWDEFLLPSNLRNHFHADWIIDGRHICKYRIQWFSGSWSNYYYPGLNDNVDTGKNDGVWNNDAYLAGRQQWSLFDDHNHYVCYCDCDKTDRCFLKDC